MTVGLTCVAVELSVELAIAATAPEAATLRYAATVSADFISAPVGVATDEPASPATARFTQTKLSIGPFELEEDSVHPAGTVGVAPAIP